MSANRSPSFSGARLLSPKLLASLPGLSGSLVPVASGATIYCLYRPGAPNRPLLLLLHGYPQNHKMWLSFAARLPEDWPLLIPDLPGCASFSRLRGVDLIKVSHPLGTAGLLRILRPTVPASRTVSGNGPKIWRISCTPSTPLVPLTAPR